MQWLIGRGGLHNADEIDPVEGPCASRLLIDLPVHCLPEEQATQRGILLRRAGSYSVDAEADDIAMALQCTNGCLGLSMYLDEDPPRVALSFKKLLRRITNSSRAVQCAIGAHLYDVVVSRLPRNPNFIMTLATFTAIRTMMETVEDFLNACRHYEKLLYKPQRGHPRSLRRYHQCAPRHLHGHGRR